MCLFLVASVADKLPFFFQALKLNMHQRGKPQRGLSRYVSQTTPTSLKMSAFAAGPPRLHGKYFGVKSWRKVNSWCVEVEKERFDTTSLRTCIFYSLHRVTLSQLRVLQFPTASSKLWLNYNAAEDKLSAGKIGKLIAYKLQVGMSSSGVLKLTQHFRCSVSVLNLHTFLIQNHHYAHCRPLRPLSLSAKSIIVLFFLLPICILDFLAPIWIVL